MRRSSQVAEKERFISFFGRDVHKLVTATDPSLWRDELKAIYRKYVANHLGDALGASENDEQACTRSP